MTLATNLTCPFCSLLCDDLTARSERGRLRVSDNACQLAKQGFDAAMPAPEAALKGVPVPVKQAVAAASRLLQRARKPLIAGLGTDVNGQRAALRLAERADAALLHSHEHHAMHHLKAMQARGGIMTTLAEVKNRADTVIFVGNNVTGQHPRFIERCINPAHALFTGKPRKLGYLGKPGRAEPGDCAAHEWVALSGRDNEIADHLALLRAALAQPELLDTVQLPAARRSKLKQLVEMVGQAQYGALVWSPAALPQDQADLLIGSCLDLLRDLNTRQRFAGLSLGGNNGGASWHSVATWQTGFPAGVTFNSGRPSGGGVNLADVDCLLWISGFTAAEPPVLDVPTIVLSPHRLSPHWSGASEADVFIPTGIPGIDHGGNLFRTDGVITLPLKKLRDSGAHSAADVMKWMVEQL